MAEPNFILAGRVFLTPEDTEPYGYWGISLAISSVFVYHLKELPATAQKIVATANFKPELDYVVGKPNDYIFRLRCTERADVLFTQKGTFTVIPSVKEIKHPKLLVIQPDYKYVFTSGFSVNDIKTKLSAMSMQLYGDTARLFTGGNTNAPIITSYGDKGRKRMLVLSRSIRKDSNEPRYLKVPYGITKVYLDGEFDTIRLPETVEVLEIDGKIKRLVVMPEFFQQDILKIHSRRSSAGNACIDKIEAMSTQVLIGDVYAVMQEINCSGEVMAFPRIDGVLPKVHSNIGRNSLKPVGEVV